MDWVATILLLVASVLAIGKGSDWLTDSLIPIARKLGISGSSVGLILVSAIVSLPEILIAVIATLKGYPAISFGVVLGSIICNIGLMTGLSAIVSPLKVKPVVILRDGIFSIIIPILVFAVSAGGQITRIEGLAFFLLFIPYTINVILHEKLRAHDEKASDSNEVLIELDLIGFDFGKLKPGWLTFILGIVLLLGGAQIFGVQLISIASKFNINELLIGLTLGALGPSIPNIVSSYKATKKGMGEIAVSETIGSNIFTMLITLGITSMLTPIIITKEMLQFDLPALVIMSFLLFIFLLTKNTISKLEGFVLLSGYLGILIFQVMREIT